MTDYLATLTRIHAQIKEQNAITDSMASVIRLQQECLIRIRDNESQDVRRDAQATLDGCRTIMAQHAAKKEDVR